MNKYIYLSDPNIGETVPKKWEPYLDRKAFLVLDTNLSKNKPISNEYAMDMTSLGIREDLYNFWFVELEKNGNCNSFNSSVKYESGNHTGGNDPKLDRCFEELNKSHEYNYLREMFLIEYEQCMSTSGLNEKIKNMFNTICLDIIAIRRMLIEYELCCLNKNKIPNITSTICSFKNFNTKFIGYEIKDLINFAKNSHSSTLKILNSNTLILSISFYIFALYTVIVF